VTNRRGRDDSAGDPSRRGRIGASEPGQGHLSANGAWRRARCDARRQRLPGDLDLVGGVGRSL